MGAFIRGLRDLGYVEGKNFVIEWRFADGNYQRLPALAGELVGLNVDVLVTGGTAANSARRAAQNRASCGSGREDRGSAACRSVPDSRGSEASARRGRRNSDPHTPGR